MGSESGELYGESVDVTSGGGGGLIPGGDYPVEDPDESYSICNNESMINLTLSSIFCNKSYTIPFNVENDFRDGMDLERIVSFVVPVLFGIIFIVGLFGNALVVIVVASNQQMRNTTNILIINLAVADLLFIIFCVPFTAADYVLSYWPFGLTWCKTVQYLIIVTAYVSVYTLVIMSVDRFLAVVYPVASISIRTEKNTYLAIAICWAIILISCLPALSAHGLTYYVYAFERHAACTFNQEYNHAAFQISFMLTSYAIPLAIICLLYFGMLFRLWKSVSAAGSSGRNLRGKKRVTRMVVVVVGVFAVCWLPIQVVLLLKSLKLYEITDLSVAIQITSHVLGYMNSCVNPLIYSVLSENFRKAFRKVIQCRFLFPGLGQNNGSPNTKARPSNVHGNTSGVVCAVANEISFAEGQRKGSGTESTLLLNETTNHVAFRPGPRASLTTAKETTLLAKNGNGGSVVTWNNGGSFDKQTAIL